jgi:hypothetical protein
VWRRYLARRQGEVIAHGADALDSVGARLGVVTISTAAM